jgi:2-haloalkanoic acid dehalogenase type II
VRALAFDVFGTLVDWRSGISEAFDGTGIDADPAELAEDWRARYRPILAEVNEGSREWGDFDDLHLVTLDDLLSERGLEASGDERRRLVAAWHRLDPWPDVREGLEALRARHVTAALSNGHIALLVDLARHGDLRVDCVLSAELARAYKPAPEVYRTADPAGDRTGGAHDGRRSSLGPRGGAAGGPADGVGESPARVRIGFRRPHGLRRRRVGDQSPRAGGAPGRRLGL